jgi:hypothetical protein
MEAARFELNLPVGRDFDSTTLPIAILPSFSTVFISVTMFVELNSTLTNRSGRLPVFLITMKAAVFRRYWQLWPKAS